jgi:hypothetical protein
MSDPVVRGVVAFRVGAGALLLVAAAMLVLQLASLGAPYAAPRSTRTLIEMVLAQATAFTACGIGFAVIWRAAHRPAARALTWFLGSLALFWASVYLAVVLGRGGPDAPAWVRPLIEVDGLIIHLALWLAPAAFVSFSAVFPRPLGPEELAAPLSPTDRGDAGKGVRAVAARVARLGARPVFWLRRLLLRRRLVWPVAVVLGSLPLLVYAIGRIAGAEGLDVDGSSPVVAWIGGWTLGLLIAFFVLFFLVGVPAAILISALNLRFGYRLADADDRRRIRWIVDGCVVGAVGLFANMALQVAFDMVGLEHAVAKAIPGVILGVGNLTMVICLAVGIFYDGALESSLIVRRSAVYTAFGVLLTFVFAGVENIASSLLSAQLGLPDGASSFVGGGAAALVFGALRSTVARLVRPRPAAATEGAERVAVGE